MKKILSILMLFVLFILEANSSELSPDKLYEQKVKSILYIETQDGSGSGIILDEDGTFVTCFHVIANADYITAKTKDGASYKVNGYKYLDPVNDVAILTLSTTKKFSPLTLSKKPQKVGDSVYTISNPKGLKFVFSNGMINQFSKENIQFSAPASPGSSGGALINNAGELIGMISSQYDPSRAQNINFAIPNTYFEPYLGKKKVINSKKMLWTDFVVSKASQKELDVYFNYAKSQKNLSMLYKYTKSLITDDKKASEDYGWLGWIALSGFYEDSESKALLDDAEKWLALSINSNKHVELSTYGLIIVSIFKSTFVDDIEDYFFYLKKYPNTKNYFYKNMRDLTACKKDYDSCYESVVYDMYKYLNFLYKKSYKK